jgi:carbon storage regulator CsrA
MLVLSRKPGEQVVIGNNITITVVEVIGNRVRIGIAAPDDVRILRGELADWCEEAAPAQRKPDPEPEDKAPRRTSRIFRPQARRPRALCLPR